MINITKKQLDFLKKYVPEALMHVENDDLGELLTLIDDAIIHKGMTKDYEPTSLGRRIQDVYTEIYNQN